jgi:hypothetical protein
MKGLFFFPSGRYFPCGLNTIEKLWWRFMPGVVFEVKWPRGQIKVGPSHRDGWNGIGEYFEYVESADPNDHYRPYLERHIGKQGWDWQWGMGGNNVAEDRLTIKIRRKYAHYATILAIKWS